MQITKFWFCSSFSFASWTWRSHQKIYFVRFRLQSTRLWNRQFSPNNDEKPGGKLNAQRYWIGSNNVKIEAKLEFLTTFRFLESFIKEKYIVFSSKLSLPSKANWVQVQLPIHLWKWPPTSPMCPKDPHWRPTHRWPTNPSRACECDPQTSDPRSSDPNRSNDRSQDWKM